VKFPKLVCAVALACPLRTVAKDCAWAALPLIVVADELAFAATEPKLLPPVAVAIALAVPPSIAVEVAVALADPAMKVQPKVPQNENEPPVACATADPPFVALACAVAGPPPGPEKLLPPVALAVAFAIPLLEALASAVAVALPPAPPFPPVALAVRL
jgi:hypothetical protein